MFMKTTWRRILPVAAMLAAGGCVTLDDGTYVRQEEVASLRADGARARELAAEIRNVQAELDRQAERLRGLQEDVKSLQAKETETDRALKTSDAAHESLKREIVDTLSSNMTALVESMRPRSDPVSPVKGNSRGGKKTVETGYEHIVKPGETLSEIAKAYKVSVGAILKANGLENPNTIRPGWKLFIPDKESVSPRGETRRGE